MRECPCTSSFSLHKFLDRSWRKAILYWTPYAIGILLPSIWISLWLIYNNNVDHFIDNTILAAFHSKGGTVKSLFSHLAEILAPKEMLKSGLAIVIFLWIGDLLGNKYSYFSNLETKSRKFLKDTASQELCQISEWIKSALTVFSSYSMVFGFIALGSALTVLLYFSEFFRMVFLSSEFISAIAKSKLEKVCILATGVLFLKSWVELITNKNRNIGNFALWATVTISVSFSMAVMFGIITAKGGGLTGGFFISGFLISYLIARTEKSVPLVKVTVLFVVLCMLAVHISAKYQVLYNWWGIEEGSINQSVCEFSLPELHGIYSTKENRDSIEGIVNTVTKHSRPDEKVFVYPHISSIYFLSHRQPAATAIVHWFDVASDQWVENDINRLIQEPPKVIVNFLVPDPVVEAHEKGFRSTGKTLHRAMSEAIDNIVEKYQYQCVGVFRIPDQNWVVVWARPNL